MVCGLQHMLAMLAGLITPPTIFSTALSLPAETQAYMISTSLIVSGICSAIQMTAIGDTTATSDVSRLEVGGPAFDKRIAGGILADGVNGLLAALGTVAPISILAQNIACISLTRVANR
ncbi:hypothetical protein V8E36_008298 [Tilletia maclaganii]